MPVRRYRWPVPWLHSVALHQSPPSRRVGRYDGERLTLAFPPLGAVGIFFLNATFAATSASRHARKYPPALLARDRRIVANISQIALARRVLGLRAIAHALGLYGRLVATDLAATCIFLLSGNRTRRDRINIVTRTRRSNILTSRSKVSARINISASGSLHAPTLGAHHRRAAGRQSGRRASERGRTH